MYQRHFKALVCAASMAMTAACAGGGSSQSEFPEGEAPQITSNYTVEAFQVVVPQTLTVSEENRIYPIADIVWRGDPPGDRYEQVKAIFEDAGAQASESLNGADPVRVTVQVARFHSLTERARVLTGGVHSMRYYITVYPAEGGEPIEGPRLVVADIGAFGGDRAFEAERQGQTMRVRITDQLRNTLIAELSEPVDAAQPQG